MAEESKLKSPIQIIIAVAGILTVLLIAIVVRSDVLPNSSEPSPIAAHPTSNVTGGYQPEIIPPPYSPEPTQTATSLPTDTPVPTQTSIVIPTLISNRQLPDLTVTAISDPVCVPETDSTLIEFNIFVRNIGRASTRDFGSFDVGVFFILGQRRYSLEEWDTTFNGVIGTSNMEVSNLHPNDDIKFTVVIDLKGNKNFGIEVVANAGENPIREADMTNNTLIKYYSGYCY